MKTQIIGRVHHVITDMQGATIVIYEDDSCNEMHCRVDAKSVAVLRQAFDVAQKQGLLRPLYRVGMTVRVHGLHNAPDMIIREIRRPDKRASPEREDSAICCWFDSGRYQQVYMPLALLEPCSKDEK